MSTNVDTSLELFLSIVEDMEEPCEHSQHGILKPLHDGPGKWYITSEACPNCGSNHGGTKLVCDRFAQVVLRGEVEILCPCGYSFGFGMEGYTGIKRKG